MVVFRNCLKVKTCSLDVQRDEEMAENDVEDDDEENIPDDFVNYSSDTSKTAQFPYSPL